MQALSGSRGEVLASVRTQELQKAQQRFCSKNESQGLIPFVPALKDVDHSDPKPVVLG